MPRTGRRPVGPGVPDILPAIRAELVQQADPQTRDAAAHFFKEGIVLYGVRTPVVVKMAARYFKDVRHLGKAPIFDLCDELLKSDYSEEAVIACDWAYRLRESYGPADFAVFERWLSRYVNNWGKCDTLCNHALGAFVEKYPDYVANLKGWTGSSNRWLRRAAAVTLILPARRGRFLDDVFEIADRLLRDDDDIVQKGYGWMLKEASKLYQEEVLGYVLRNRQIMPRTALRYAIEKMPADLRRQAMKKD